MGEVVDWKTCKLVPTGPVPESTQPPTGDGVQTADQSGNAASGNQPDAQAHPLLAGCLMLACPCGSCSMEMWAHGVIVYARCQRLCGSAVWNYTNRQGPGDAERTAMPDHSLPPSA